VIVSSVQDPNLYSLLSASEASTDDEYKSGKYPFDRALDTSFYYTHFLTNGVHDEDLRLQA
jgi:hypothetical protein